MNEKQERRKNDWTKKPMNVETVITILIKKNYLMAMETKYLRVREFYIQVQEHSVKKKN